MRLLTLLSVMLLVTTMVCAASAQGPDMAPKHSIKEVMIQAHKPPANLLRKTAQGKASAAEKQKLLELYRSLAEHKPGKGSAESWAEKTGLLVSAAEAAVNGDADAPAKLTKASSCAGCHKIHK